MEASRLKQLLAQYRPEKVVSFQQVTVGISNETYVVTTDSGARYVIRVIHNQTADSARVEARIQQAMVRAGLSTPLYLRLRDGEHVGRDGDDAFTIADFIAGSHPETTTLKLVASMGRVLGRLHAILHQDELTIGFNTGQWLDPRNARADALRCEPEIRRRLETVLDTSAAVFEPGLPMAVIHGELATNNFFAANDEVTTIFDFETVQHAPRLLDVAYTYMACVYDDEMPPTAVLDALIIAYNAATAEPLTPVERSLFPTALRWVAACAAAWCFSRGYADYGEKFLAVGLANPPF
jgi:Ser/Thr protein kinase RdoA (MazF antagonist)